jgi:hypothetical protein
MKHFATAHYRTVLLTEAPIHENVKRDVESVQFEHYIYNISSNKFESEVASLSFDKHEKPLVITHFLPEFLKCYVELSYKRYGVTFRHLVHIVHPHSTFYGPKQLTLLARIMIRVFLKKRNILFMDETCANECFQFYRLPQSTKYELLRLPLIINDDNSTKQKNREFNILTITRYEFPFKGYVLGLIRSFSKLCQQFENISLTIIGYGRDEAEVKNELTLLEPSIRSKITTLAQVPYIQVENYIRMCDCYVGMGTTVLDAANLNKIVITAVAYQREDNAVGFFHENYQTIGEIFNATKKYPDFESLLEKVISLKEDAFRNMSTESKKVLIEHYDISQISDKLITHGKQNFTYREDFLIRTLANIQSVSNAIIRKLKG